MARVLGIALHRRERSALVTQQSLREARKGLHILVVEDNEVNLRVAVSVLEKRGHTVVAAMTGRQALRLLETQRFDLALVDLQMPKMDGFELTAAVRAREAGSSAHLPIIALAAHAMKGDRERCLAAVWTRTCPSQFALKSSGRSFIRLSRPHPRRATRLSNLAQNDLSVPHGKISLRFAAV
jgi:CheY-like chemotaxis protein